MPRDKKKKKERIPFRDRKLVKWTKEHAPDILGTTLEITGDFLHIESLKELGEKIQGKVELSPEEKAYAMELLKLDIEEIKNENDNITSRWTSDNQADSWLSKNIRPLTLAWLLLFMSVIIVLDSIGYSQFEVKESYISMIEMLLVTVIIGYFGSRGIKHLDERRLKHGKDPLRFNEFNFNKKDNV